jgi:NAD(P)-dependent dehydrogenase (short-subunit alcohol dehydrogenase family)
MGKAVMGVGGKDRQRRVAVVTGGGQGLGREVARQLANAGFAVAVIGRTQSKLDETVGLIGTDALAVAADLTDPGATRKAFGAIVARFGGVDVLVNNAANYFPFRVDEASDDEINSVISATLVAPIYCIREAIPLMRARGGGDILNVSSQSVQVPQPFLTVYSAAKAGLDTLAQGLRYELKGESFRIITFQVGTIAESSAGALWTPELIERVTQGFEKAGISGYYSVPGASVKNLAATMLHALTAPREICAQVIEMRTTT